MHMIRLLNNKLEKQLLQCFKVHCRTNISSRIISKTKCSSLLAINYVGRNYTKIRSITHPYIWHWSELAVFNWLGTCLSNVQDKEYKHQEMADFEVQIDVSCIKHSPSNNLSLAFIACTNQPISSEFNLTKPLTNSIITR